MSTSERNLAGSLIGLIVSLLLVGVVSSTLIRHALQAMPAALALVVVVRRQTWASYAALPVFIFWLLIILAIWLFLLGITRIVTGHFTTAEVALTLLIATSSICGIAASIRPRSTASLAGRVGAFVLFAVFQIGGMWLSLQQPFVHR